ncbi:tRNA3(Ser)-specific nuclease WapA precursor [Gimesia chilikensis]|uniref:tRNA3(Ser)-specific nuclease WapA n=1 Tax=Gimesia chilikensis TaxID=2605989 RepID=A0A517W8X4_9PLAN|nr:RHS repeat-associated core domain-containing protein [Gimesia chilikensis]QDU01709.1 tRNA3(Ser)-specific nuclease WapA precursor [Gimesia chilikensis]
MENPCCSNQLSSKIMVSVNAIYGECSNLDTDAQLNWNGSAWVGSQSQGYNFSVVCHGFDSFGEPVFHLEWSLADCGEQEIQSAFAQCTPSLTVAFETTGVSSDACCDGENPPTTGLEMAAYESIPYPDGLPPVTPPCDPAIQCCYSSPSGTGPGTGPGNGPGTGPGQGGIGSTAGNGSSSSFSGLPIRYGTGEFDYSISDFKADGYGIPWGHTRSFRSRLSHSETIGQGYNWQVKEWPFLVQGPTGLVATEITQIVIQGTSNSSIWFDKVDGVWVPRLNVKSTLEHDTANQVYRLTDLKGNITEFDDYTGMFYRQISPAGNTITVTGMSSNGSNFTSVERECIENSLTTTEKYEYAYENQGDLLLSSVVLSRKVGAGSWEKVSRVLYAYYGENEPYGLQEDLKTATTQEWDGNNWQDTGTNYYRYYKSLGLSSSSSSSSSSSGDQGFVHEPKYILNKEAYNKLAADPNVSDPLTATDAQVAQYADYYFEFDELHRVTKEIVQGGSRTFTFSYEESGFDDDYNAWKTKTTETLPDGSQNIVYSNYVSQPMLKILKSGEDEWYEFFKYDDSANIILQASSSAISGYDDQYADLLHEVSGNYQYLRDSTGLIRTYTYHAATNWLASSNIQEGELGSSIKLLEREYIACGGGSSSSSSSSSSASRTAYFLSKEVSYPSETDQTKKIITSYAYTWYEGTCQVKEITTTLPVISTSQNGSGVANTIKEYFDEYGYLTWTMDERGYINQNVYDIPTGAITQQIQDVDTGEATGVPAGWVTPSGGGLNLVTDYELDDQGRITQELGPTHTIDLEGVATEIRTGTWYVYKSDSEESQIWQGQGYATGTSPSYTYTLVNPVSILKLDKNGNSLESIQATRTSTSGKLLPTDTFAQASYVSWTTNQYTECCLLESSRVYHTIPTSGSGSSETNYDQTNYGYDSMKRQNRTETPGGTITFNVLDVRGNVIKTFVGTDDTGATSQDPTGGGAVGNNMVQVSGFEYDEGTAGGDNNLTQQTAYAAASDTRITSFTYDWRNRNVDTDGEIDFFQKFYYDNLDRVTKSERYDTTSVGNLIARSETKFDDLGRVYQTVGYGVDPSTGTVGNSLTNNTWYDPAGNAIKQLPSGSDLFTKNSFDSLGRSTAQYIGYDLDETSYSEISDLTGDTILEQTETTFDDASNVIESLSRMRYHDAPASQTGALQDPSTTPKARVIYLASYPDALGRTVALANYGTNGGTALSRSTTIPTRSDSILVTTTAFDAAGRPSLLIGPDMMESRKEYDAAGRSVKLIENYQESSSSSSSSSSGCTPSDDANRTTTMTYTSDGTIATLTAENSVTGNQVTTYTYGTTLSDSEVATSVLLQKETYPDSTDANDVIKYTYNRQAQVVKQTELSGTIHEIDYDKLGRPTQDRVTTLGTSVDGAVRRIGLTFDSRSLVSDIISYDNATVGQGTIVNATQIVYNDFGQGITSYQSHSGAVNVLTTPKVQYSFANGSDNTVRHNSLTYPDGRVLTLNYSSAGSIDDATSRVFAIIDDDVSMTHLVEYSYLGLGGPVIADDTESDVRFTLVGTTGGNDPDTGDIYRGLDRFGRTKDSLWYDYGASVDRANIQYGYDRASNLTYRDNRLDTTNSFDEYYTYDGLQRLKETERGALNAQRTGIGTLKFAQCWSLDETGNWKGFQQDDTGNGTWNLQQTRTSNKVNEITDITESSGSSWITPAYSKAGNMTTIPRSVDPTTSFIATYDAWNRLVKITDGSDTVSEYEYDGRNFRITQKSYTSGVLSETRHFYYTDSWQTIEERIDSESSPERQYVWGLRYLDDLVLRDRDTTGDGTLDERLYALQDGNWNVTAICDENGDVQERYAYDSYGAPTFLTPSFSSRSNSSFDWDTLFTGYRWETASELFHVRNRVYHSVLGCWIQRDRLGYIDGANLYIYVSDNPLGSLDTYGNHEYGTGLGQLANWFEHNERARQIKFENSVKDALKKDSEYRFPGNGKASFDACFSQLCRMNPRLKNLAYNEDARRELGLGCQGVTSLLLGKKLASNAPSGKRLNCYSTLENAKAAQKNVKCTGTNNRGTSARSGIFGYNWKNRNQTEVLKTDDFGKIIWSNKVDPFGDLITDETVVGLGDGVHDFAYYDPTFDAFWGANYAERDSSSYIYIKKSFAPKADLNPSTPGGAKVYCVVCESNEVPVEIKPEYNINDWIQFKGRYGF